MLTPEGSALVRDTEDWLRELRNLKRSALSRRDVVQADELQAEIDELTALLDMNDRILHIHTLFLRRWTMGLWLSGFFLLLGPDVIYRYLHGVLRVFIRDRIL